MKYLVIVESPTKARTISRFLGKDYQIKPSMGHVKDLPKSKLGVDIEHDFAPQNEIIEDKIKIIEELRSLAKDADMILLATDPDREGEAISSDIKEILSKGDTKILSDKKKGKDHLISQSPNIPISRFKRIVFHEITEGAIREALENPRDVDEHLVDAQTARRVLDRLVGYKISPVLWRKVRRGLSAGRVQSVALRLIVEREREIEKFGKEKYWTIAAIFGNKTTNLVEFSLFEMNGEKVEVTQKLSLYDGEYTYSKTVLDNQKKTEEVVSDIKKHAFVVGDVQTREIKRSPYPPFTTSTLQQQAAQRFGFPGKKTMSLAQKLYEEGFITYHRTDSVNLSPIAITQMREFIGEKYGSQYVPEKPRLYFTKQKNAQEAHEAIRPTKVSRESQVVGRELGELYGKLYDLIWKRTVSTQMPDARIESTTVYADAGLPERSEGSLVSDINKAKDSSAMPQNDNAPSVPNYRFKATGSVLLFDGFLKLTPLALDDNRLPKFTSGEGLDLQDISSQEHETTPPPRYNDASLIKTLEEKSIGRPSTYASIVSTITDRGYIERLDRKFVPTTVGGAVNDFLVKNFSAIDDVPFTAQMEDDLDMVANGEKAWRTMMRDFYTPFQKQLKEVEGADRVQIPVEETDEMCPECKVGKLVIRSGKFGKFLSCSKFPECKFTKALVEETNFTCPKCGGSPTGALAKAGKVVVKKTRKGRKFYGCANYPACDFAAWNLNDLKNSSNVKNQNSPPKADPSLAENLQRKSEN